MVTHHRDSDCRVRSDGAFIGSGVEHGGACTECGARGFHDYACSGSEGISDGSTQYVDEDVR